MNFLQPEGWKKPSGYSNGVKTEGEMIFVAGQVGWNEEGKFVSDTLCAQIYRALENVVAVLKEGNAGPQNIVRMTWYVTDLNEYRASMREIGEIYRSVIGNHYPVMSLVQVTGLLEKKAKVEIEATAVVPRKE